MFGAEDFRRGPPVVGEYDEHVVAPTSYGAATGGPGPEPRLGALAFRQRVLAEAALRLITPGRRHPLIVVVPRSVEGSSGFDLLERARSGLAQPHDRRGRHRPARDSRSTPTA